MPPNCAIYEALESFGPEEDRFLTPRICGFISASEVVVGIVSKDGIVVRDPILQPGEAVYLSTYVKTDPDKNLISGFDFSSVNNLARYVHEGSVFQGFSNRICTVASTMADRRFMMTIYP